MGKPSGSREKNHAHGEIGTGKIHTFLAFGSECDGTKGDIIGKGDGLQAVNSADFKTVVFYLKVEDLKNVVWLKDLKIEPGKEDKSALLDVKVKIKVAGEEKEFVAPTKKIKINELKK